MSNPKKGQSRLDRGGELRKPKRMPNGTIRVDAVIARTGVLRYRNADGSVRREYRPPEEVFDFASRESAEGAPVTDDHPPELLELSDVKRHSAGALLGVPHRDGDRLVGTMIVHDDRLIDKMERGKREVSSGYRVDLYEESGVAPDGEPYDFVQRNIRFNHVAIVDRGRSGPEVRVRMDAVEMLDDDVAPATRTMSDGGPESPARRGHDHNRRRPDMGDTKIDKSAIEAAAKQLSAERARADAAEARLVEESARADQAEGAVEALRQEINTLRTTRVDAEDVEDLRSAVAGLTEKLRQTEQARKDADSPERLRKLVQSRVKIETAAREVLGDEARLDDVTDRQIMVNVIEKLHGKRIGDDRTDQYVAGQFDTAMEGYRGYGDAIRRIADGAREIQEERVDARQTRSRSHRDVWKDPLPNDIRRQRQAGKDS